MCVILQHGICMFTKALGMEIFSDQTERPGKKNRQEMLC